MSPRTPMTRRSVLTITLVVIAVLSAAATVTFLISNTLASLPAQPQGAALAPGSAAITTTPTAAPAPESSPITAPPLSSRADGDWLTRTVALTGIPERALAAYAGAEIQLGEEQPSCGVSWNTLAAIGAVESEHGTIAGGHLDSAGSPTTPVIGIALDGSGVAAVRDTDGGALDGDAVWDRAVGPMQFIPSTWLQFAADGNGDGLQDVNQIDDATLAAARYLCAAGGHLGDADAWIGAIASYNSSLDYNNRVAAVADAYAAAAASGADTEVAGTR